ncbi:hypothetical protein D0Z07_4512 [Hyphodiscus hymeniophilus]|uniref:Uncharacterized protein n=1 Tax=Hyphodiscus hymeniophilus TaxID=353542 RepID=A0A9P7AXP7_9HELO|nr:hypothetical protein D0Z07_4512 [Hyphodiscus hymeniophilus]
MLTSAIATGVKNLSKEALTELAKTVFGSVKESVFTTVSVNGTKDFTAWEWTAVGVVSREIPGFPLKVGDSFKMVGCSLFWWVGTGDDARDWKIRKESEYTTMIL